MNLDINAPALQGNVTIKWSFDGITYNTFLGSNLTIPGLAYGQNVWLQVFETYIDPFITCPTAGCPEGDTPIIAIGSLVYENIIFTTDSDFQLDIELTPDFGDPRCCPDACYDPNNQLPTFEVQYDYCKMTAHVYLNKTLLPSVQIVWSEDGATIGQGKNLVYACHTGQHTLTWSATRGIIDGQCACQIEGIEEICFESTGTINVDIIDIRPSLSYSLATECGDCDTCPDCFGLNTDITINASIDFINPLLSVDGDPQLMCPIPPTTVKLTICNLESSNCIYDDVTVDITAPIVFQLNEYGTWSVKIVYENCCMECEEEFEIFIESNARIVKQSCGLYSVEKCADTSTLCSIVVTLHRLYNNTDTVVQEINAVSYPVTIAIPEDGTYYINVREGYLVGIICSEDIVGQNFAIFNFCKLIECVYSNSLALACKDDCDECGKGLDQRNFYGEMIAQAVLYFANIFPYQMESRYAVSITQNNMNTLYLADTFLQRALNICSNCLKVTDGCGC